jgi:hypothetical protein
MQIEVFDQSEGLHGGPEVWVKVLSNTAVDWQDVERALTEAQREVLKPSPRQPKNYHPHLVTVEEKAEHGYSLEDWWIFSAPFNPNATPPARRFL